MKRLLFVIALALVGCGSFPACLTVTAYASEYVPLRNCPSRILGVKEKDVFAPYIEHFADTARAYNLACYTIYSIRFSDIADETTLALCQFPYQIVVDRGRWELLTAYERTALMYHELGHCALLLPHTKETEVSIMNPYLLGNTTLKAHWPVLVDMMFTEARKRQKKQRIP